MKELYEQHQLPPPGSKNRGYNSPGSKNRGIYKQYGAGVEIRVPTGNNGLLRIGSGAEVKDEVFHVTVRARQLGF